MHELNKQEYLVQYIPSEPARYQLRILFNNELVQGKTFDTDVYSLIPPLLPTLSSFPIINIQKVSPNDIPRIGDNVCLQSNSLIFKLIQIVFFSIISQY